MMLKAWFFLAVVLTALLMGTSFVHVLEAPAKLQYSGAQWLHLQQTLYREFAWVGGPIELGAIAATAILALLLRRSRGPFLCVGICWLCLATAFFGIWMFITNAANAEILHWTPASLPADWPSWRLMWEYSHVARFVLHLAGFGALLAGLLRTASACAGPR